MPTPLLCGVKSLFVLFVWPRLLWAARCISTTVVVATFVLTTLHFGLVVVIIAELDFHHVLLVRVVFVPVVTIVDIAQVQVLINTRNTTPLLSASPAAQLRLREEGRAAPLR